ncbi:hypothetical protein AB6A40_010588 [Gnathostoma spinigerum]|uniref:Ribosome assembly factor mrt4 n=1 Tax=Gnathostoma spinigerum TaxID=75299 RepID=A0ABD6EV87_9BILA
MPRSKREKDVSLTKVTKKTRERKINLIEEIRKAIDYYQTCFVFNVENMRSNKFVMIRQKFKDNSRLFFGRNTLMAMSLGKDSSHERAKDLAKVTALLKGDCGLMFTNADREAVVDFFKTYEEHDFARSGQIASVSVDLSQGALPNFSFTLEPQMRRLGLPTKLEKGVVTLLSDYRICKEGDKLNAEQAKLLKLLGYKISVFKINLIGQWTKSDGFKYLF